MTHLRQLRCTLLRCVTAVFVTAGAAGSESSLRHRVLQSTQSSQSCRDVPGWKDKYGWGCDRYESDELCTLSGNMGFGWDLDEMGTLQEGYNLGFSGRGACCVCGGGVQQFPGMWKVHSGLCKLRDGCIHSPGYPGNYHAGQHCTILINDALAKPIDVVRWDTEGWFDILIVNGVRYTGERSPQGITPKGSISWDSAEWHKWDLAHGWKICPQGLTPATTSAVPAPATTSSAPAPATTFVPSTSLLQSTHSINSCTTAGTSGVGPGIECVLPFKYGGATYSSCTRFDAVSPWCSTQTDGDGNHINGQWGYCSSSCPTSADAGQAGVTASSKPSPSTMATQPSQELRSAHPESAPAPPAETQEENGGDNGSLLPFFLKTGLAALSLCVLCVICLKVRRSWKGDIPLRSDMETNSYGRSYAVNNL
eukprot:TRINITY_DN13283_c0_g1_i2.p1 TRINITY_DN13283_c0_g1~~TRINITY_DN13283_c0_g1_i2.p1  ORF type:complete len:423 (-),score=46.55 TRINITY_DN13283_c0_g1_i2:140-1408(-)